MGGYLLRRLALAPIVLIVIATLTFFIIRLAPGDPFAGERSVDPIIQQARAERYGFDKPLIVQYGLWLSNVAVGNLDYSLIHKDKTVNEIIHEHLPQSAALGSLAIILALLGGVSAGVIAAWRQNSVFDYASMTGAMLGLSIPSFVIGPLLALWFGSYLGWLPVGGWGEGDAAGALRYLILPAITLALPLAARIARLARAGVLDVARQDFVRTARAKGLRESYIVIVHVLRGGLLPVMSFLGPAIAGVLTGSLVVEQIFQIPGIGSAFVHAALNRDYTLVMGTVLVYGAFLVLCNALADIAIGLLDPRVRLQ